MKATQEGGSSSGELVLGLDIGAASPRKERGDSHARASLAGENL